MTNPNDSTAPRFKTEMACIDAGIDHICRRLELAHTSPEWEKRFGEDIANWIDLFKTSLPDCCPGHRSDAIEDIQSRVSESVIDCMTSGCTDDVNHSFLTYIVISIEEAGGLVEHQMQSRN